MKLPGKGDQPFDTWGEIYLGWTAAMFTVLVAMGLLYWLGGPWPCVP